MVSAEEIKVVGFWANSNNKLCKEFIEGHVLILKQHGFTNFVTQEDYWANSNLCYVLLASIGNVNVGGVRIEIKDKTELLPTEKVLKSLDQEDRLSIKLEESKCAEICGLWNSKLVAGKNLSVHLSRASAAIAPLMNLDILLCFNATYTFRIPRDTGCRMITDIGENGYINYPSDRFRAALWVQDDLNCFSRASKECVESVLRIRKDLNSKFLNKYNEDEILISYELEI